MVCSKYQQAELTPCPQTGNHRSPHLETRCCTIALGSAQSDDCCMKAASLTYR